MEGGWGAGDMVAATAVAQAEVVIVTKGKLLRSCYVSEEERMWLADVEGEGE